MELQIPANELFLGIYSEKEWPEKIWFIELALQLRTKTKHCCTFKATTDWSDSCIHG